MKVFICFLAYLVIADVHASGSIGHSSPDVVYSAQVYTLPVAPSVVSVKSVHYAKVPVQKYATVPVKEYKVKNVVRNVAVPVKTYTLSKQITPVVVPVQSYRSVPVQSYKTVPIETVHQIPVQHVQSVHTVPVQAVSANGWNSWKK